MDTAAHVAGLVREADPARYLSALYAPETSRRALLALYAFNAEIAAVRDRIREPAAGEIRLQWWNDAIAAAEPTGNPVADELIAAKQRHALPAASFQSLLDARIFDLYQDPMPDRGTLEGYLGETRSALIQLAALVLDPVAAPGVADAAGHAGCALGIAEILRDLPAQRHRQQCLVPGDILAAAGLDAAGFLAGETGAERGVAAMGALGAEHLRAFRGLAAALPASLRPAFLPVATAAPTFAAAERLGRRALDERPAVSPLRIQWRMFAAARGRW